MTLGDIADWIGSWFTVGEDLLPTVSGRLVTAPPELDSGVKGTFRLEFQITPGKGKLGIETGHYDAEIKWDPTDADTIGDNVSKTNVKWRGNYVGSLVASVAWDYDGSQDVEWEILLVGGSGSVADSVSGSHAVLIKQP